MGRSYGKGKSSAVKRRFSRRIRQRSNLKKVVSPTIARKAVKKVMRGRPKSSSSPLVTPPKPKRKVSRSDLFAAAAAVAAFGILPTTKTSNDRHQLKRRKPKKKKPSRMLFSNRTTVKTRPFLTLLAQRKYAQKTVPLKLRTLEKDAEESCRLKRFHALETLETNLLNRLGLVSSLRMSRNAHEDLVEMKYQVISELEAKLLTIQQLEKNGMREMTKVRCDLREKLGRFICCEVCGKQVQEG